MGLLLFNIWQRDLGFLDKQYRHGQYISHTDICEKYKKSKLIPNWVIWAIYGIFMWLWLDQNLRLHESWKKKANCECFLLVSFCLLKWNLCNTELNHKISRLHERCLDVVYYDAISSFKDLLKKYNSAPTQFRNMQVLAAEYWNIPKIMPELFPLNQLFNYKMKTSTQFLNKTC